MDFRQLESFLTVTKYNSFSKASRELFLTQPALSNQIKNLEKDLERKRLFDIFPHFYRDNNGSICDVRKVASDGLNLSKGLFHGNQDYKSFREELRPLFSHNLTKNEPGLKEESIKDEKLAEYEKQLKSAINSEDFEQAAKLRDQIQAYKAQNGI